jgi:hypothetical protein
MQSCQLAWRKKNDGLLFYNYSVRKLFTGLARAALIA